MNEPEEISAFDLEELVDGYRRGYLGLPLPAMYTGAAYLRGWNKGRIDGGHGAAPMLAFTAESHDAVRKRGYG
jgi:hypothetical protein